MYPLPLRLLLYIRSALHTHHQPLCRSPNVAQQQFAFQHALENLAKIFPPCSTCVCARACACVCFTLRRGSWNRPAGGNVSDFTAAAPRRNYTAAPGRFLRVSLSFLFLCLMTSVCSSFRFASVAHTAARPLSDKSIKYRSASIRRYRKYINKIISLARLP